MRATTIFVFLVLLFGIYQVGFVTMHAIGTPGNPTPAAVTRHIKPKATGVLTRAYNLGLAA